MLGHPVVGIGEVGLHKVLRWKVVTDQAGEIGAGFFGHAIDEIIIETIFRVETNVGLIAAHVAQVQPVIRERTDKPLEARVGEQAIRLGAQGGGLAQLVGGGQSSEACVRSAVGKEVRQTIGDREMIGGVRRFAQIEEVAGAQEGFVGGQEGIVERLLPIEARLNQPIVLPQGILIDRFAGGLAHEIPKQGFRIGDRDMFREEDTIG